MYQDILKNTKHREIPLPNEFWILTQQWHHLLFIHLPFPKDTIKAHLPEGLELDTYNGMAWISIIPFKVTGMRMRNMPAVPYLSAYLELNVRTYVKREGIPGVYFFSLDADKLLPVFGARIITLPYFHAKMNMKRKKDLFYFESNRRDQPEAIFKGTYQPISKPYYPEKHSLSNWLLERYVLWTYKYGALFRGDIHHTPWEVHDAEVIIEKDNMLPFPFDSIGEIQLSHYASYKRVLIWPIRKVK
ncbi:YqjF family protein [Oceanobacillus polygoni]|uniref:Uncharacterized protein YqjF (DUF2071 family) n=1 Tax=Oceanobacillus polygoni TaxID=1235259 RepID=A0A9X1CED1_9BACI|nr:DUF2071 domain-containing protein [Oceanobacillus polygoni]MBP2079886.1 uncharacterized protein YqjF (DUF2071 family) [Oceanobacillus polygoni]